MRTSSKGEYEVSTGHLLQPGKASSDERGLHLIVLLAKGAPWKSTKNPEFCYNKCCCLQTDSQDGAHLQGQYPHSSLKIGEAKLGSTLRLHPNILVFIMWGGTRQDVKREMGTPIQSHNHWPTICPA